MGNDIITQRKNWDRLSNLDPYWAILVDSEKINMKWEVNEFYSTGKKQIYKLFGLLNKLGINVRFNRALDYGCGVGRLSEALADYFEDVIAVDFSQNTLNLAKTRRQCANLTYQKVNGQDISNFPSKTFDFVVSLITLQHSPSKVQYNLLKEMVRVIKDDGVIAVTLVTHMGLGNFLRNVSNNISPKITNLFLQLRQRVIGKKIGHYDIGIASQMFPVSKRKVLTTMKQLGLECKYLNTSEISGTEDSSLEIFIIYRGS